MQSHRKQIYTVYTFNPPINENLFHIIAQNKITQKRYSAILHKIKFANKYAVFFRTKMYRKESKNLRFLPKIFVANKL